VIDDHSRVAYAEICTDETAATAIGVLERAVAWFADRGVPVERVLSDNGSAYRSFAWRDSCAALGIKPKHTRPYRPQTNGKSSASTAPSPRNGPTPATTAQRHSGDKPCPHGFTSTITTEPTAPSEANRRSAD
jgi:transposase InsO family protein